MSVRETAAAAEHVEAPEDGLAAGPRLWAFAAIAVATFIAVLDGAIANIALPPITQGFGIRPVDAIWIVNAYQLAVTVLLLPLAKLGEVVGYRRVYLGGLLVFTLASLACALSTSLPALIASRALQGFGAAGIMSVNIALVRFIVPQALLGRSLGYVAMIVGVSSAAGPTIAGLILAVAPWQALFLLNLPLGALALLVGWRMLPRTMGAGGRFDVFGALLSAATFGLLISGINGLGHAEGLGIALAQIAASLVVGLVFVRSQLTLPAPLLPIDLLRLPVIALSAVTSILSFGGQAIAFVCLPFLFHDTLGRSATETGLLITPWPVATAIAAVVSGRLADRLAPGKLAAAGLALFSAGLLALALLPAEPTDADIVWRLVLAGTGFGLFQTPNNKLLIGSAPRERSGGAAGIQSTARLLGQSGGTALLAVVFGLVAANQATFALMLAAILAGAGVVPSALRR
jgi:MFS transporter, DHA2 family, multidrug resistance protein